MSIPISEYDRCPACKKKTINLLKEREGKMLMSQDGAFICSCGNHYTPKSMVGIMLERASSPIIRPDQIKSNIIQG